MAKQLVTAEKVKLFAWQSSTFFYIVGFLCSQSEYTFWPLVAGQNKKGAQPKAANGKNGHSPKKRFLFVARDQQNAVMVKKEPYK